jgi:glycosyltransferase involved in cell wall biosynthesis
MLKLVGTSMPAPPVDSSFRIDEVGILRILFLEFRDSRNPFIGGGDIYINKFAEGCARLGHNVTVISSCFPGSKNEEVVNDVHVIRVGKSGFSMFVKVFLYYFRYLRGNFDVVVEEILGGPRVPFFGSLYIKERVVGILQQRHKALFQHQFSFPIAFSLSLLERFLVLPYKNKSIVVNSLKTREDLGNIGYNRESLSIIHPGLPDWFFLASKLPSFCERPARVICLTKIRGYKLIDEAIRALKIVCKALPNCELVIAGRTNEVDPAYEEELRRQVIDLGLSNNVQFRKDISEKEKIELLSSSRVLVLPSVLEGFGIVVIEANACGTPVVVSDGVPADAAVNNYNALVFPRHDIESMSKSILSLLSDEVRWTLMSSNSTLWIKRFSQTSSVEKFISVICANSNLTDVFENNERAKLR